MILKLAKTEREFRQILDLQSANHFNNINTEVKEAEGFVTVRHTLNLLKQMNNAAAQIIAVDNDKVIAYALVMLNEFQSLIPVLKPMYGIFDGLMYQDVPLKDLNYYVMGQICIDKNYRGTGLFKMLYQKHKEVYSSKFDLCLTEVSTSNPRSMKAHEKVGFKVLKTYQDKTDEWNILSWDWN